MLHDWPLGWEPSLEDPLQEPTQQTALLVRIVEKLDVIDARTSSMDERALRIEEAVHRQGTLLDSGLRRVDERCATLAAGAAEHRQAVDAVLAAKLAPPPTWRERLSEVPDEQKAAAVAAVALAALLARRQSRRAANGLVRRLPVRALLLAQLASVVVLLTSQAADSVHALPLVGRVLGPPHCLERPRKAAQCCFVGASVAMQWKLVLALVAASHHAARGRRAKKVV